MRLVFGLFLLGYLFFLPRYIDFLKERPIEVKLGYMPHPLVLRATSADQQLVVAQWAITKTLFYFGTLIDKFHQNVIIPPEFENMYKTLQTAIELDPYNMDAYYFIQASFPWELNKIHEANDLLKTGLKYRSWDPWIPFYIGFNYAYFLNDYEQAAPYMKEAAERSGNVLFGNLAARYFYESAQTDFGLMFLDTMIQQANDESVRQTFQIRKNALLAINKLEQKITEYAHRFGHPPAVLEQLIEAGLMDAIPEDPYGGSFYLDSAGRVRTTSKFAKKHKTIDLELPDETHRN